MKLNISDWESFCASDIFFLYNGSGITKEEIEDNPGSFPAVQSGADNNGCIGYISKDYCKAMNYTYVEEPCLTVARTGSAGFVAFQPYGCVVGDSAKILLLKNTEHRKPAVYLFLRTILMANQYKYTYGRKVTEDKYLSETLLLPSVDSITPDWASMEKYILSLHHKPLKTAITEQTPSELNTKTWHEFFLHRILICSMGNGIDAVITTSDEPKYNYVSRDSNGNGVVGFVDEIEGEEPFPAGAMSLALGGSFLGSCFIQKKPFYTAQNVAVLQEKVPLSDHTKLFIATLIRNECKIKYQAFGRELNAHFRKDFTIKLPVKRNADVLKLFCTLLDNAKFRRVFSDNYPLILIDEYQDSYKPIITRFVNFFIAEGIGPQFGFFGDAWQTIYQSNNACGAIEHSNLVEIKKGSNFRSAPRIVNLLNEIRPDLPQQSAIDNFEGEVVVVTCDDFSGARRSDRTFKDDLPAEELKSRLYQLSECIKKNVPKDENIKILMITHKVLATQQGYEQLLAIIDDGLRDKQDPFLLFFMNTVEPIYEALSTSNMQLLFDTLGIRRYPITKKSEKMKWKEFEARLKKARDGKAIDVINTIVETKLVPVPSLVDGYYHLYFDAPDTIYGLDATIRDVLDLDYSQFRAAIEFLYPEAEFSTEHGVKGEEYDNVVFVISKGWNQYQFETYAPMITGRTPIPNGKQTSYERNRNLFYVCCSRPRKRLFFFVSVPIDASFRVFLDDLVGAENIYTYGQYLEAKQ